MPPTKWYPAVLLIGPTGSGKSPLGDFMEAHGFGGVPCVHFDFGENLRRTIQSPRRLSRFSVSEIEIIRESLSSGRLLENEHFPIAEKIFRIFSEDRKIGQNTFIILNGLPRHVGQARDCGRVFDIRLLVQLICEHDVILKRIRRNVGGDRQHRTDDSCDDIRKKLDIYAKRTQPLIQYYQKNKIPIQKIEVTAGSRPSDTYHRIIR